jgi:hypothetical protein
MNTLSATAIRPYLLREERYSSLNFQINEFDKMAKLGSVLKKIYKHSFLNDFYSVLTSKVK